MAVKSGKAPSTVYLHHIASIFYIHTDRQTIHEHCTLKCLFVHCTFLWEFPFSSTVTFKWD